MNTTNHFAARLRELRTAAGLTQHDLAARSGMHRQAIAKLELAEREPSWASVLALAKALGVSIAAFETAEPAEAPARARGRPRKAEETAAVEKPAAKPAAKKDADAVKPSAKGRNRKGQ